MERLGVNSVQLMLGIHMMQVCGLLLSNWVSCILPMYLGCVPLRFLTRLNYLSKIILDKMLGKRVVSAFDKIYVVHRCN
jgi:hypothetical protein